MKLTEIVVILVLVIVFGLLAGWTIGYGLADGKTRYPGCHTKACERRMQARGHATTVRRWKRIVAPHDAHLNRIAYCESRQIWTLSTGNGYYGGLQFSLRSWQAVGGSGYPHIATQLEQKYRAVRLSRLQGWSGGWPVCGSR